MNFVLKRAGELTATEIADWTALQQADPAISSAFFRPEYALAVEEGRGGVEVVLATEDGRLAGLLPFEMLEKALDEFGFVIVGLSAAPQIS